MWIRNILFSDTKQCVYSNTPKKYIKNTLRSPPNQFQVWALTRTLFVWETCCRWIYQSKWRLVFYKCLTKMRKSLRGMYIFAEMHSSILTGEVAVCHRGATQTHVSCCLSLSLCYHVVLLHKPKYFHFFYQNPNFQCRLFSKDVKLRRSRSNTVPRSQITMYGGAALSLVMS